MILPQGNYKLQCHSSRPVHNVSFIDFTAVKLNILVHLIVDAFGYNCDSSHDDLELLIVIKLIMDT